MKIQDAIYFDCQATLPMNDEMLRRMATFYRESIGNPHSNNHRFGWQSHQRIAKASDSIARLLGADADEVVFTSGATEANNQALLGVADYGVAIKRKRILISAIEHKCVLEAARRLEIQYGYSVEMINVNREGLLDLEKLENHLADDVLLVSVMAVNNEVGTIQELEAISKLTRQFGALLHTDAAQAPITMSTTHLAGLADLVSLSSHKLGGPAGIGALYVSRELSPHVQPLILGGGQQNGLRSGTIPLPLCLGFASAIEDISDETIETRRTKLAALTRRFVSGVAEIGKFVQLNGPDFQNRHIGNANIRFEGHNANDLLARWQPNLAASTGSACSSGIEEESYVLRAIGLDRDQAEASIRFSMGFDTTDSDVDEAIGIIGATFTR